MADRLLLADGTSLLLLADGASKLELIGVPVSVNVNVTNVASATALGDESVTATASVSATTVSSAAALGNESVTAGASSDATGVASAALLNNVTVDISIPVNAAVTGVESASGLGDESVTGTANASVTNVASASALGDESVTVTANPNVAVTGVESASAMGDEVSSGTANASVTGVASAALLHDILAAGQPPFTVPAEVEILEQAQEFQATFALSSVSVTATQVAPPAAQSYGGGLYGRWTEKETKPWQDAPVSVSGVESVCRLGFAGAAGTVSARAEVCGVKVVPSLARVRVVTRRMDYEREASEAMSALLAA